MKRKALIVLVLAFVVLCGCRTRLMDAPEQADDVIQSARPDPPPTPTLEPNPEPSPEPTPEPSESAEPPEASAPEEVTAPAQPVNPASVGSLGPSHPEEAPASGVTATYDSNGGDNPPVSTVVTVGPASTVFFDGSGGRVKSRDASREVNEGDILGTLPTPLREGYRFDGWFTLPEGGERVSEETVYTGSEDWTLYAHWTYDPYEFWSFTLRNRTQQIFMCQQVSIYFETKADHVTAQSCSLITAIGAQNVAENREDVNVTDDWVLGKRPQVVVKEADSLENAAQLQAAVSARFPEQKVVLVTSGGLGGSAQGLYARLALAKALYGDWYTDVDLSVVAAELEVAAGSVYF